MTDDAKKLDVTEEDLQGLPRWAGVAFVIRCARRVQPIFNMSWPEAPVEHIKTIDAALYASESAARNGQADLRTIGLAEAVRDVAAAYDLAVQMTTRRDVAKAHGFEDRSVSPPFANPTPFGKSAVIATAQAIYLANSPTATRSAVFATFHAAAFRVLVDVIAAARADFELLKSLAVSEEWTNESPVDPDLLGPLWPQGVPGWLSTGKKTAKTHRVHLEFSIPQGVDEEEADAAIVNILASANKLHLAMGGSGLHIAGAKAYDPALVEEPVGGGQ